MKIRIAILGAGLLLTAASTHPGTWSVVAGSPEGMRYSNLTQLNRDNAGRLQLAWKFDTGDEFPGSEMQCNPIVVDGVLYATTPRLRVIALDAATGQQRWAFDPFVNEKRVGKQRNRGLTYWSGGRGERRIFVAAEHHLYALDAVTGKPATSFGRDGRIDLRVGLGREPETLSVNATSPGIIHNDLLIMGTLVSEDLPSAPGISVRTTSVRARLHGPFTPTRSPANSATRPGRRTRGSIRAE